MTASSPALLADPEWLAHRFVESADAARFIRVPRGDHGAVPFLTELYLGEREPGGEVPLRECLALPGDARLGLLFHSAFCGSTMLVRGLSQPGVAMGLSEPQALNDTNDMQLHVFANEARRQAVLVARLDNLGKGASGAAVQNVELMLGLA